MRQIQLRLYAPDSALSNLGSKAMADHLKCTVRTCIATRLQAIGDHVSVVSFEELRAELEIVVSLVDAEEELA